VCTWNSQTMQTLVISSVCNSTACLQAGIPVIGIVFEQQQQYIPNLSGISYTSLACRTCIYIYITYFSYLYSHLSVDLSIFTCVFVLHIAALKELQTLTV